MLDYKLIVSDFDGTLCGLQKEISEGNRIAIRRYTDAGGVFAICTGRMISSILPHAKSLGLCGPVVAYQGAIVEDVQTQKILYDSRISWEDAYSICVYLQINDNHIHVYDGEDFYVNKEDSFLVWYEKVCRVQGVPVRGKISDFVREHQINPHKIIVICKPDARDRVLHGLQEHFGDRFYITTSNEYLVEIVAMGSDKGSALKFLANHYKIPLSQTIAIGDNYNDLPMIQTAGLGVAVGDAEDDLKREADFVTRSCAEDGVAYTIYKFGLGEEL